MPLAIMPPDVGSVVLVVPPFWDSAGDSVLGDAEGASDVFVIAEGSCVAVVFGAVVLLASVSFVGVAAGAIVSLTDAAVTVESVAFVDMATGADVESEVFVDMATGAAVSLEDEATGDSVALADATIGAVVDGVLLGAGETVGAGVGIFVGALVTGVMVGTCNFSIVAMILLKDVK